MSNSKELRPFRAVIYESDLALIREWVLRYETIETGGDLFGLWSTDNTVVIQFVLGPGKESRRTSVSFYQDCAYLAEAGCALTEKMGLCHVGEWHSHHSLGLYQPSSGDQNTVRSHIPEYKWKRFVLCIANHHGETKKQKVALGCFLFQAEPRRTLDSKIIWHHHKMVQGGFVVISKASPFRDWPFSNLINRNCTNSVRRSIEAGAEEISPLSRDVRITLQHPICVISSDMPSTLPEFHRGLLAFLKNYLPGQVVHVNESKSVTLLFCVGSRRDWTLQTPGPLHLPCKVVCQMWNQSTVQYALYFGATKISCQSLTAREELPTSKAAANMIRQMDAIIVESHLAAQHSVYSVIQNLLCQLREDFHTVVVAESLESVIFVFSLPLKIAVHLRGKDQEIPVEFACRLVCRRQPDNSLASFLFYFGETEPLRLTADLNVPGERDIMQKLFHYAEETTRSIFMKSFKRTSSD